MSSKKTAIVLNEASRFRSVYGGLFDIANTRGFSESELKHLALFSEQIIVPDAFFYCYGNLFDHIHAVARGAFDGESIIGLFLEAGIIVPAIRSGESMLHLWENRKEGVAPGQLASAEMEEGKLVLDFVDRFAVKLACWPEGMAKASTAEFAHLVNRFIVSDELSPIHSARRLDDFSRLSLAGGQASGIRESFELVEKFSEMINTNQSNTRFRRGDIEKLISDHLGKELQFDTSREQDPRLYSSLENLREKDRGTELNLLMCEYILNTSSTIYEAFHSNQFHTIGSLFAAHDEDLIARGVYQQIARLEPTVEETAKYVALLEGEFDASKLTAAEIIEIRKTDEFKEYTDLRTEMKIPRPGESFQQANQNLCYYFVERYMPSIIKKHSNVGMIRKIQKTTAAAAATSTATSSILGYLQTPGVTTLMVSTLPILTLVTGVVGTGIGVTIEPIAKRLSRWRLKRMKRRLRNNYTVPIK